MIITDYYSPESGLTVISPRGSQRFPEYLDSYSRVYSQIKASDGKFSLDSAWESGDIYYIDSGTVTKMMFTGTEIASATMTNPVALSVIQYAYQMEELVTVPPQQDRGCWIADQGAGRIFRTDNLLRIIYQAGGVLNPVCIVTDVDDGCYVADDTAQTIRKFNSDGSLAATLAYGSFLPSAITQVQEMKTYRTATQDRLWVLSDDKIYGLYYRDGTISQWTFSPIDPFDVFSSSSSGGDPIEEDHVGSIDVDRNTNDLYVTGGDGRSGWILKYDGSGSLKDEGTGLDITFPYLIV